MSKKITHLENRHLARFSRVTFLPIYEWNSCASEWVFETTWPELVTYNWSCSVASPLRRPIKKTAYLGLPRHNGMTTVITDQRFIHVHDRSDRSLTEPLIVCAPRLNTIKSITPGVFPRILIPLAKMLLSMFQTELLDQSWFSSKLMEL